jgi:glycogen operon protein
MMKNAVLLLMLSQGVPLITMGDEVAHTKYGNNNTYCHDNELNWFDWGRIESNADIWVFFQRAITFRKEHPILRHARHLPLDNNDEEYPPLSWHGVYAWRPDWSHHCRTLAFMLTDPTPNHDDFVYCALNMHWETHDFELPHLPLGTRWHLFAATDRHSPDDIAVPGREQPVPNQRRVPVGARAIVVLVGRREK